jgi:DnaJ-class molecular chaperone
MTCPTCNGSGKVTTHSSTGAVRIDCARCGGSGQLPDPPKEN